VGVVNQFKNMKNGIQKPEIRRQLSVTGHQTTAASNFSFFPFAFSRFQFM